MRSARKPIPMPEGYELVSGDKLWLPDWGRMALFRGKFKTPLGEMYAHAFLPKRWNPRFGAAKMARDVVRQIEASR